MIIGATLLGVYLSPMTYLRYMWVEFSSMSTGVPGGCNSTSSNCRSMVGTQTGAPTQSFTYQQFDLDNGWGYTYKLTKEDETSYTTNGAMLNGKPCETPCAADTDGKYFCTSSKSVMPNVKGACAKMGYDWMGNMVPKNATWRKEINSGVFEWKRESDGAWIATHTPLCYSGSNIYTCALSKPAINNAI